MTREEALNILHNASVYHPDYLDALNMAIEALEQSHTETVTEFADRCRECGKQKKGKWINKSHTSDCGIKFVASECTCCGKKTFFDCDQLVYNYCPNCGAEMRGGNEGRKYEVD